MARSRGFSVSAATYSRRYSIAAGPRRFSEAVRPYARRFSEAVRPLARRFSAAVIRHLRMQERECPLDTPLDTISLDSGEEDNDDREEGKARLCSRRLTFLLTCLAPSADIINVWRYPYIAYKHGGVVLVPCVILFILIGFPLYYLEQTIGRLHAGKKGGGQCLGHLVPFFKGVGYAYSALLALMSVYYMAVVTWVLLYLFSSMQETLPWAHCGNGTVVSGSVLYDLQRTRYTDFLAFSILKSGIFVPNLGCSSTERPLQMTCLPTNFSEEEEGAVQTWTRAPSEVYFHSIVVRLTKDEHLFGSMSWTMLLCLLGGWIVTYLNVIRGKISFRKTAILPAIIVTLFLCGIFGSITSDPGFQNGLHYYFSFDWKALRKPDMWNDAAAQVALSLGTGTSLLQLLGRRGSKYRGLVHDAVIVVLVNIIVSFFSGVVVFSCLGAVAKAINRPCIKFLEEGFGTLFSVVPAALASLPGSVICSILFFSVMALLCLGRMEQMVLTLLMCLLDKVSSNRLRKRYCFFVLGVCCALFATGSIFTTSAGIHVLAVMDTYVFSWAAFLLGFLECVVVTWLYGFKQFSEDCDTILQQTLGSGWMVIWSFITPGTIMVVSTFTAMGSGDITSGLFNKCRWGPILGWTLFSLTVVYIPGYMIYKIASICFKSEEAWTEMKKQLQPIPICTSVMKADKHTKDGKELTPAPRILVIRKDDNRERGQVYIPYGFVVCPEKSPKSTRTGHNKLVFSSFPEVDQSYSLTDSNVTKLMPPPRCEEIFFYTPQMSRLRRKLRSSSTEQLPQTPSSSSSAALTEMPTSDTASPTVRERSESSNGKTTPSNEASSNGDSRIVLSPTRLSKLSRQDSDEPKLLHTKVLTWHDANTHDDRAMSPVRTSNV